MTHRTATRAGSKATEAKFKEAKEAYEMLSDPRSAPPLTSTTMRAWTLNMRQAARAPKGFGGFRGLRRHLRRHLRRSIPFGRQAPFPRCIAAAT